MFHPFSLLFDPNIGSFGVGSVVGFVTSPGVERHRHLPHLCRLPLRSCGEPGLGPNAGSFSWSDQAPKKSSTLDDN